MTAPYVMLPKYDPICSDCGHSPGVHTTTSCANIYMLLDRKAACDCKGWKRDQHWPPSILVEAKNV